MRYLVFILLVCLSCNFQGSTSYGTMPKNELNNDSCAINTTINFFKWYKLHFDSLNSFMLIKYEIEKPYRVDFKNADKYISLLRASRLFSEDYQNNLIEYFRRCDKTFLKTPQYDGPAWGFEFDLFLYCQDYEYILNNYEKIKYTII